jgi:hypothetical protein
MELRQMPTAAPKSDRIIAIGDIHGCSTALDMLIAALDPQPQDVIVTLSVVSAWFNPIREQYRGVVCL